eukprot:CAMPEP_0184007574 /NCGR_PEP_ID=MMETSP0954-20121128/1414_1 /TAXON_ID=627963 /ORGANISM="Aplanochytrium sp, Strain PBS07" /LENGTH=428 /DNA_ID=CAMNT_0026286429 /DNA_START=543 /DNA_END=1827 /DNA_ORIENTATION=-
MYNLTNNNGSIGKSFRTKTESHVVHRRFMSTVPKTRKRAAKKPSNKVNRRTKTNQAAIKAIAALESCYNLEFEENPSYIELTQLLGLIKRSPRGGRGLSPELSSELLNSLCKNSLFGSAYEILELLHMSRRAKHIDYIRVANAAASKDNLTYAAKASNLAHRAGFCIDHSTSHFLVKGLCLRSLLALELSNMLESAKPKSRTYKAEDFLKLSNNDTRLVVEHLLFMARQGEVIPEEDLYCLAVQLLVIQSKYHTAVNLWLLFDGEDIEREGEGSVKLEELGPLDDEAMDAILSTLIAETLENLEERRNGDRTSSPADCFGEIEYEFTAEHEQSLFEDWHRSSLRGWGPFFILKEIGHHSSKSSDLSKGPMMPLSPDASEKERRKHCEDTSIYHSLKALRKTSDSPPIEVLLNEIPTFYFDDDSVNDNL